MKLSIRISVWILLIILLSSLLSIYALIYFQHETGNRDFREFGSVLADTVYDDLRRDMLEDRRDHIQPMLKSLQKQSMINEVVIYSWNRRVALSAEEKEIGEKIRDNEVLNVLATGKRIQRVERKYGRQEFCILIPVKNDASCQSCHRDNISTLGVIEIGLDMNLLSEHLERDAKTVTFLLVATSLFILLSVLVFLRHVVLKRLLVIVESIRKVAAGDYTKRVQIESSDELGFLAQAFNTMAEKVQKSIEGLKSANKQLDYSLTRFGKLLTITLDLDKLSDLVVNELAESAKSPQATILLRREDNKLMLMGSRGISLEVIEEYDSRPDLWGEKSLQFTALQHSEYLLINDSKFINKTQSKQIFSKIANLHGENDFYVFPLISSEKLVGLLTMVPPSCAPLGEAKLRMVQLLCQEAATAIENADMHKLLEKVSITDELTQIYNQRHFFNVLKDEMDRAERYGHTFSLVFLDLDKFKLFNDSFGHLAGNRILRKVSQLIMGLVRSSDQVFRYGGDEFALILPDTDVDKAIVLANRIREEIKKNNFGPLGTKTSFRLSASAGVVGYDGKRFREEDEIFKAADDALHEAKKTGRDVIVVG